MAEIKCPILRMDMTRLSLEDIFLELTEDKEPEVQEKKRKFFMNRKEKKENKEEENNAGDL